MLPLILSPERDEQLAQITEHRVSTFAHDLVPDYLRTKLEPLAETKMMQLEHKAATLTFENAQVCVCSVISYYCFLQLGFCLETSHCLPEGCIEYLGYCE